MSYNAKDFIEDEAGLSRYDLMWSSDYTSMVNDLFEAFDNQHAVPHRIYYPFCKLLFLLLILDRQ